MLDILNKIQDNLQQIKSIINVILSIFSVVSILIIFLYGLKKKSNFIDFRGIISNHFNIFNKDKKSLVVIYICPIFIAINIAFSYPFKNNDINVILVFISIIISSLLAFQSNNIAIKNMKNSNYKNLIDETNASILFVVFINVILIFITLIYAIFKDGSIFQHILTAVIIYFIEVTYLTLLIIMKRMGKLLE